MFHLPESKASDVDSETAWNGSASARTRRPGARFGRIRLFVSALILIGLGAVSAGIVYRYLSREKQLFNFQLAGQRWEQLEGRAAAQDVAGVREALATIETLTPDDPRLLRWQRALDAGHADENDSTMVRFVMNQLLRAGRVDDAAREASAFVARYPKDWQARCILAHSALEHGDRSKTRQHLSELPNVLDLKKNPGPGPILYAIRLHRQLGLPDAELLSFLSTNILPELESSQASFASLAEKLQILEAFELVGASSKPMDNVAPYWVPIATLGRQVLEDRNASCDDLVRLSYLFEGQLSVLLELRRQNRLPAAEISKLYRELESRIEAAWLRVLACDARQPAAYIGLALANQRTGKSGEAVATLTRGLSACGDRTELLAAFAAVQRHHDPQEALDLLQRAAREHPEDDALKRLVAETAMRISRADVALAICDEAIAKNLDLPWARRVRAKIMVEQNRPSEAITALEPIRTDLLRSASDAELWVTALAQANEAVRIEQALADAKVNSAPVTLYVRCGRALLRAERIDLAERWAAEALRVSSNHRDARVLHADCLRAWAEKDAAPEWNSDRVRAAVRACEWLRQIEPDNLEFANNLAWLQLKGLQQPALALSTAAPLRDCESSPQQLLPEMLETLGAIYLELGQTEKAARLFERAIRESQPSPSLLIHLARAYLRLGRRDAAKHCIDRAAKMSKSIRESSELNQVVRSWRGDQ